MSTNVKIEDLFKKDIKRQIDGVIKVDKYDDESVYTELDEYVVTQESLKHFDRFFDRYYNATHTPTDPGFIVRNKIFITYHMTTLRSLRTLR